MQKEQIINILKNPIFIILVLMLLQFFIRVHYIQDDNIFSTDSYFHIRQIENIKMYGVVMHDDANSFFEKIYVFTPLYHYFMAILLTFLPSFFVLKIIPLILSLLVIPTSYLLTKEIVTKKKYAYVTAFFVGMLPGVVLTSTNVISTISLFLPVIILFIYSLYRIRYSMGHRHLLLATSIIAALIHPAFIIFILGLYVFAFIQYISGKKIFNAYKEFMLFITLFCIWLYAIIYKKYLKIYGLNLLTQNLPDTLRKLMFPELTVTLILSSISILVIIASVFSVYREYASGDPKKINILFAMVATILILLYLNIIPFGLGIIFTSIILTILAAVAFEKLEKYISKTRVSFITKTSISIIVVLMLITIVVPSLYNIQHRTNVLTYSEKEAFLWLKEYSKKEAVIFTAPETGQALIQESKRTAFFDNIFLGFPNLDELNKEIIESATYQYGLESLERFNNVNYIVETPKMTKYLGSRFTLDQEFECMKKIQEFSNKEDLSYARIIFNQCEYGK